MRPKVLITTPDYLPKIGGLTTFTLGLEHSLKDVADITVFLWKNIAHLRSCNFYHKFDYALHVHHLGGYFLKGFSNKNINFFHGSEILFYSPNIFNLVVKKILKKSILNYLQSSYFNISISNFTFEKVRQIGLEIDHSRDIVFHNTIDTTNNQFYCKNIQDNTLRFAIIARDVPHKNIDGAISFVDQFCKIANVKGQVFVTSNRTFSTNSNLCIKNVQNISDKEREIIFQQSHFNVLMSLDNSRRGFFEGFGLTVLEAGKYGTPSIVSGTGGLSESVHSGVTGWIATDIKSELVENVINSYENVSKNVFEHTRSHHSHVHLKNFLGKLLGLEIV